jgi:hypothetical protein
MICLIHNIQPPRIDPVNRVVIDKGKPVGAVPYRVYGGKTGGFGLAAAARDHCYYLHGLPAASSAPGLIAFEPVKQ